MSQTLWHKFLAYSAAGLTALVLGHSLTGQEIKPLPPIPGLPEPTRDVLILLDDVTAGGQADEADQEAKKDADKTEYWIGIGLAGEVPEVAKEQLGVKYGLVVADVLEESPAAKAEVKKYDILIKADGTPLKEPVDLIKSVEGSHGKALKIILFRQGKEATVEVTPAKRPISQGQYTQLRVPSGKFGPEIKGLEEALAKLKGKAGEDALSLFFARPGVMAPSLHVMKRNELPKNMSIQINKEGNKPAKIHVKKDDQEWEVTDDKLGDLPEDVRTHVQQFLARPMSMSFDFKPGANIEARQLNLKKSDGKAEAELKVTPPAAGANRTYSFRTERSEAAGGLESKLDAVIKKLDQLTKEVDELKVGKK